MLERTFRRKARGRISGRLIAFLSAAISFVFWAEWQVAAQGRGAATDGAGGAPVVRRQVGAPLGATRRQATLTSTEVFRDTFESGAQPGWSPSTTEVTPIGGRRFLGQVHQHNGGGFKLDDEKLTYPFYEQSKKLGLRIFSVHKGYASQSRTLGHLANPADVEKAALDYPDLTFIIYHSALKHDPGEPQFKEPGFFDATTGDFAWHDVLMKLKQRNPQMNNVYCEIGSAFGSLAIQHPVMAQHLIGKNVKHYGVDHVIWGTDCLWWGSPQWVIDAFKRFQISDELCEKFGYRKLTKDDRAKIFGLNAAKVYGVDVKAQLKALPADSLTKFKATYASLGGGSENAAYGWVRAE